MTTIRVVDGATLKERKEIRIAGAYALTVSVDLINDSVLILTQKVSNVLQAGMGGRR
jgi:hypothetical protein